MFLKTIAGTICATCTVNQFFFQTKSHKLGGKQSHKSKKSVLVYKALLIDYIMILVPV